MKRIAFLVLTFATVIIAQEDIKEDIKKWAEVFHTDEKTIKFCVDDEEMTKEEFQAITRQLEHREDDNLNNKTEEYSVFMDFEACIMEEMGMIKDSKLVVDQIMEYIEINMGKMPVKSEQFMRECFNKLNDKSEMDVIDRILSMPNCVLDNYGYEDKNITMTD